MIEKSESWYLDFETKLQTTKYYALLCLNKAHNFTRWFQQKQSVNKTYVPLIIME